MKEINLDPHKISAIIVIFYRIKSNSSNLWLLWLTKVKNLPVHRGIEYKLNICFIFLFNWGKK